MQTPTASQAAPTRSSRSATLAAVCALMLVAFVGWAVTRHHEAPNVVFHSIDGQQFDTASLKGKVVLVNFWATSCVYCVHEMPGVANTYRTFRQRGLEVVAVAMDYDPPSYVLDYAQSRQLPFRVAIDTSGEAARRFGNVEATPTTLVINRQGQIVARYEGELDFTSFNAFLDRQLAKAA